MRRHDGETVGMYEIPIVKTQKYTLDELLDKGMFFLLSFYAFTHEKRLALYEADERELDGLMREIETIKKRL